MALYYFKSSGEFDAAVRKWENKPTADKTWKNIKMFISAEYAREDKQNKLTAKQFKANMIEEQAAAMEELIANINEAHTCQLEALIKSTTDAMKEMMQILKDGKNPTTNDEKVKTDKQKKREEGERNSTTHRHANIAQRNIRPRRKTNAGNWRPTNPLARETGNRPKTLDSVRGPS